MKITKHVLNIIVLCLAFGICGCRLIKTTIGDPSAVATVDIPYKGDVAAVKVKASPNENCFNAIGHLRNRDWQHAVDELNKAIVIDGKDTKDAKARFALGVAYEMLDHLDKALENYKAANLISGDPEYSAGVDRVEDKLKQKAGK